MANKKITLKSKSGDVLYPQTVAEHVKVNASATAAQMLADHEVRIAQNEKDIADIKDGTVTAGNAEKLDGSTKEEILNTASADAGATAGNMLTEAKAYADSKFASVSMPSPATDNAEGTVRLATQEEVNSGEVTENIPSGSDPVAPPAVVVTPATLKEKLSQYPTNDEMTSVIAEEIAKVVASAPEDYDTLKEIAAYIESDKTGAADMNNAISALQSSVSDMNDEIGTLKNTVGGHSTDIANIKSNYLTVAAASSTYLSKSDASASYALKTELIDLTYTENGEVAY